MAGLCFHTLFWRRRQPKRESPAKPALRCSFCNKSQDEVRKLIAGPVSNICDECVDVCVDIIAHDRVAASRRMAEPKAAPEPWPPSDAWCSFCGNVAALETALLIENRTLLCESCVASIAAAAAEARGGKGGKSE